MAGNDARSADESFDERPAASSAPAPSNGAVEHPVSDPAAPPQPDEIQGEDIVIEVEND
jgi:hypothetical protein